MTEWIIIVVFAVIAVIGIATAIRLSMRLKKSRYDFKHQQAVLDDIRYSLEQQMYGINDRLLRSEERWKDVNHLLLNKKVLDNSEDAGGPKQVLLTSFLEANGITENDLHNVDERLVFVLTPFHPRLYDDFIVIKGVCSELGFKCKRGDEDYFKGDIFPQMLELIVKARIIVANINGRNPNVMYELGVAQALDKKVILLAQQPDDLPIDIQSQRFLIYQNYHELQELLKAELKKIHLK